MNKIRFTRECKTFKCKYCNQVIIFNPISYSFHKNMKCIIDCKRRYHG